MNVTLLSTILQTILNIIPQFTNNKEINAVISMLTQIVPVIIKEAQDLLPMVQNVIAALSSKDEITPAQMDVLKALDAQTDQGYDAIWAAYAANHPAKTGD
jgi:uncharacterized protein YjgD (DUF1641 family)